MRITTTIQQPVVVCLQVQHVAGLPAAAEGRQVLLRLFQQPTYSCSAAAAAAVCRGGVAAFHDQVLLLDCVPVSRSSSSVAVAVTVDDGRHQHGSAAAVDINLTEQLRRPSPRVLSFVIGGAVLSLTLHHRLVAPRRRHCNCMAADMVLSCLRVPTGGPPPAGGDDESLSSSSSGFITIEKGTVSISRRRPPSDNMLTTDDEEVTKEEEVEDEFLAMLDADDLLDLDALISDAEAERAS